MTNRDVIEFECPRCLNSIRVSNNQAGQRVDCPECKGSLLVPAASSGNELFDDLFDSKQETDQGDSSKNQASVASDTGVNQANPPEEPLLELDPDEDILSGFEVPDPTGEEANPLEGKDPFEVDPDAAIKIDGVGDLYEHADVYGVKCDICDTRIHELLVFWQDLTGDRDSAVFD